MENFLFFLLFAVVAFSCCFCCSIYSLHIDTNYIIFYHIPFQRKKPKHVDFRLRNWKNLSNHLYFIQLILLNKLCELLADEVALECHKHYTLRNNSICHFFLFIALANDYYLFFNFSHFSCHRVGCIMCQTDVFL